MIIGRPVDTFRTIWNHRRVMNRLKLALIPLAGAFSIAAAAVPDGLDGYEGYAALSERLETLTGAHPHIATLSSIGKSFEGRDLWLVTLGEHAQGKPAIYLDAAHDGSDLVAGEVATRTLRYLLEAFPPDSLIDLLEIATLYAIPRANPDGVERAFASPARFQSALVRHMDDDRDDEIDEDGPNDLDGDGAITSLRVEDPGGSWRKDDADPRLMVEREPGDEGPFYRLYVEGLDDDADGHMNEDPEGGVHLQHNFPQGWEMEHAQPGAGPFAASELETLALLEFFVGHPEIATVISLSQSDRPERAGVGHSSRVPHADADSYGMLDGELESAFGREIRTDYRSDGDAAFGGAGQLIPRAQKRSPTPTAPRAIVPGLLAEWTYFQAGAWSYMPQVWVSAPPVSATSDTTLDSPEPETRDPIGRAWLEWIDANTPDGFAEWSPFDHPTLGPVEVGGFRASPRRIAPPEALDSLATETARFVIALAGEMPSLSIAELRATREAGPLYRLTLTVTNTGKLPTLSVQGVATELYHPILAEARLPAGSEFVGCPDRVKLGKLDAGKRRTAEWLIRSSPGEVITVHAWSVRGGRDTQSVTLGAGSGGD